MPSKTLLPGLDQLLDVVARHAINAEIRPAGHSPPRVGELVAGQPLDPLLAAVYARLGGLAFKPWHHLLLRWDDEINGVLLENHEWSGFWPHPFWPEHFRALVLFGTDMGYRYATVPALASQDGLQPVVYLDPHEDIYALPIASDVDRFLATYSRYLELVADEPDFKERYVPSITFPWDTPELLAADVALVEMIRMGKFDQWMHREAGGSAVAIRDWMRKILAVRSHR